MQRISLGQEHHKEIKKAFPDVSRQTIYAALSYFNNSETAQAIRAKAKELLQAEIEKLKIEG
jgi:uncharacterized protein (DUF433 family)